MERNTFAGAGGTSLSIKTVGSTRSNAEKLRLGYRISGLALIDGNVFRKVAPVKSELTCQNAFREEILNLNVCSFI